MLRWLRPSARKISVLAGLSWTVALLFLYASLSPRHLSYLNQLSWDESYYLGPLQNIHNMIRRGAWGDLLLMQDDNGYGTLFWWIYGLFTFPFGTLIDQNNGWFIWFPRALTAVFQGGSLYLCGRILNQLGAGRVAVIVMAATLFFMPGLILTYKPFSPDYIGVFLFLSSVSILLSSLHRGVHQGLFLLACVLGGMSCGVKWLNSAMALVPLLMVASYWLHASENKKRDGIRLLWMPVGVVIGFVLTTPIFLISPQKAFQSARQVAWLNRHEVNFFTIKAPTVLGQLKTWFLNHNTSLTGIETSGIRIEFLGYSLLALVGTLVIGAWARSAKTKGPIVPHSAAALLWGGILSGLIIMFALNRVWTWHLIGPALMIGMGIGLYFEDLYKATQSEAKPWGEALLIASTLLVIHIGSSFFYTAYKISESHPKQDLLTELDQVQRGCSDPVIVRGIPPQNILVPHAFPYLPVLQTQLCDHQKNLDCYLNGTVYTQPIKVLFARLESVPQPVADRMKQDGFKARECAPGWLIFEK